MYGRLGMKSSVFEVGQHWERVDPSLSDTYCSKILYIHRFLHSDTIVFEVDDGSVRMCDTTDFAAAHPRLWPLDDAEAPPLGGNALIESLKAERADLLKQLDQAHTTIYSARYLVEQDCHSDTAMLAVLGGNGLEPGIVAEYQSDLDRLRAANDAKQAELDRLHAERGAIFKHALEAYTAWSEGGRLGGVDVMSALGRALGPAASGAARTERSGDVRPDQLLSSTENAIYGAAFVRALGLGHDRGLALEDAKRCVEAHRAAVRPR